MPSLYGDAAGTTTAGKTSWAKTGDSPKAYTSSARRPDCTGAENSSTRALSAITSPPIGISAVAVPRPISESAGQPLGPSASSLDTWQFSSPNPLVAMPISLGSCRPTLRIGVWLAGGVLVILKASEIVAGAPRRFGLKDALRLVVCSALLSAQKSAKGAAAARAATRWRTTLAWVRLT
jgi:hypothetical protein